MEFERLTDKNKVLIGQALVFAYLKGYSVWFANYQKEDREGGTPDYEEVCMGDILSVLDMEDFTLDDYRTIDFKEVAEYVKESSPEFNAGGCNDLRIASKDEQEYYYIWYFDHRENRIYTDGIRSFFEALEVEQEMEM